MREGLEKEEICLEQFLGKYHFDSPTGSFEDFRSGFTPLFYAALAGNTKVTSENVIFSR